MSTEHENLEPLSLVQYVQLKLVELVEQNPRTVLVLSAVLVAISAYLACTRLTFLTQRNDLVSPHKDEQARWRQYVAEFGDDDDMVVVVKGAEKAAMQTALEDLAQRLADRPKLFDRIFYKVDLRPLRPRALLYLSTQQIRDIQDNVRSMQLLLDPPLLTGIDPLLTWKALSLSQLLSETQRRAQHHKPGAPLTEKDKQLFTQLAQISGVAADVLEQPQKYRSPWQSLLPAPEEQKDLMAEPQYFFSGDGSLAFLLVRPIKDTSSFTSAQDSIDAMREVLQQMRQHYPNLEVGLTGLPVLENDEMTASQNDTATASWLALLGVGLLYLLVYRCWRYPLLTMTTLLVGTVWALGWLTVTIGHLNILSATFAVMLIGMGDYGILWVTRYEQERAGGCDVAAALRSTTLHVGPSILTASLTTALAFYTAMLADFQAVAELGWIAGSGVLLCALACFTVLPALLRLTDRQEHAPRAILPMTPRTLWLPILGRHPRWVIAGVVLLAAACSVFACRIRYDHNLLHLQARGLESVKWELTLIEHTEGASWHALSYTTTPEEALALKARYEKLPVVSRVVEVASLVPRDQELKLELLKDIRYRLRKLPPRGHLIPHARPDPEQLQAQTAQLLAALQPLAEQNAVARQLRANVQRLQGQLQQNPLEQSARRLQDFEQCMTRDLAEDLHRLRDVSTPTPITVADLPTSLRERYVGQNGKWLLRIFGGESLWEYDALAHFVQQIKKVDPEATGKPFSTLAGLQAMREGFKWAGIYALLAMVVILLLDFRNLWHMLLALAPLALGLLLSLGIMGMLGWPLNPANTIALPLILGVGADNGVHILHDFLSRRSLQRYALGYCTGRGIMVAALTTILGFGTLMISHHRGLAGLGLLLTLGVTCCMLTALIFLPAVLRLLTSPSEEPATMPALSLQPAEEAA